MKKFKEENETMSHNCELTQFFTAQVISFCKQPRKAIEIMNELGLKHWKTFQTNYLKPLLRDWLIPMLMNGQVTVKETEVRIAI